MKARCFLATVELERKSDNASSDDDDDDDADEDLLGCIRCILESTSSSAPRRERRLRVERDDYNVPSRGRQRQEPCSGARAPTWEAIFERTNIISLGISSALPRETTQRHFGNTTTDLTKGPGGPN